VISILQASLLPRFTILGLTPNLLLLTVLASSIRQGPNHGMMWAWIGGMVSDLTLGATLGLSSLALIPAALLAGLARHRPLRGGWVTTALIIGAALAVFQVAYLMLQTVVGQTIFAPGIRQIVLPLWGLHLLAFPLVYAGVLAMGRLTGSR
jgi:rod shape-determining protein MreD